MYYVGVFNITSYWRKMAVHDTSLMELRMKKTRTATWFLGAIVRLTNRLGNIDQSGTLMISTFLDPRLKLAPFSTDRAGEDAKQRVRSLLTSSVGRESNICPTSAAAKVPEDEFDIFGSIRKKVALENKRDRGRHNWGAAVPKSNDHRHQRRSAYLVEEEQRILPLPVQNSSKTFFFFADGTSALRESIFPGL